MGMLETRFRRAFRPHEGGYLFRQWGADVRFELDEVEAFVAEWRAVWVNPWFWTGYILFGLALPGVLVAQDYPVAALMLALLTALFAIVALVHVLRRRNGEAALRVPMGGERAVSESPVRAAVRNVFLVLFFLCLSPDSRDWYYSPWFYLFLLFTMELGVVVVREREIRKGRHDSADSSPLIVLCRVAMIAVCSAWAVSPFLKPGASWLGYAVGAAAAFLALWILVALVRGRPMPWNSIAVPQVA